MSSVKPKSPKSPEELNELFQKNHVLSPSNKQNIITTPKYPISNDDFTSDDSSIISDANLSKLDYQTIENDPKTPARREEFRRNQATGTVQNFSPAQTELISLDSSSPSVQSYNNKPREQKLYMKLMKSAMDSSISFLAPDSSVSDLENNKSSGSPAKSNQVYKQPTSILKKSNLIDSKTLKGLDKENPELIEDSDENQDPNPTKTASRVLVSPKKKDIIHTYSYSMNSPSAKNVKHSSPLSDTLNGNTKTSFSSPYLRSSSKRKSSLNKQTDEEWIDDRDKEKGSSSREGKRKSSNSSKKLKNKGWISLLTSFKFKSLIDPQLPYILSLYLQLVFNVLIVSILLYFIYSFVSTVKADVENKVDSYASDIIQEIALCSREYLRNNCQPGQRVIALETACSQWEKCMNQDPTTVGRAKIGAETFAEIINGFIKPISWKSMIFLFLITVGSLVLTNAAFGTYRNYTQYDSSYPNQQQQQHQQQQQPVQQQSFHTPYQTPYKSLQYDPSFTRFYTPKPMSPSFALSRQRNRSSRKFSRR